jgi:D-alanyl-D-alanine carboxypeptidase/D-alanyl-D-alanine-endopeptidase (penicillin-binding protein 4)
MRARSRQIAATTILYGLVVCALLLAGRFQSITFAQEAAPALNLEQLGGRIADMIRSASLGDGVAFSLVDLRDGREVFSHQGNKPLNPASNMKVVTAAVALRELGPDFRMLTTLQGKQVGDAIVGGLYLRGTGDPELRSADLTQLAQELASRGVRKIDEVWVDGSYFDDQVLPPGFEQQPDEVAPFRAAVAAVAANASAYTLNVRPGAAPGEPVVVDTDAPGHFELDNGLTTSAGGVPSVVVIQRTNADKLALRLRGEVPAGVGRLSYRRRVESPLHYAGYVLVEALRAYKIQVPRRIGLRVAPPGAPLLASHSSRPLGQLEYAMGKDSDNFTAEMVLKVLGAEREHRPGRSADGAAVALRALKLMDIPVSKLSMVNGSGLFTGNLLAASHLTRLLAVMYADPKVRSEFIAQLATGGVDGTLAQRFAGLPFPGAVRAKTGTLDSVIALSGYVLGPVPGRDLAFSYIANGVQGKHQAARELADAIAVQLGRYLYAATKNP